MGARTGSQRYTISTAGSAPTVTATAPDVSGLPTLNVADRIHGCPTTTTTPIHKRSAAPRLSAAEEEWAHGQTRPRDDVMAKAGTA